jgi:hypothetical protein
VRAFILAFALGLAFTASARAAPLAPKALDPATYLLDQEWVPLSNELPSLSLVGPRRSSWSPVAAAGVGTVTTGATAGETCGRVAAFGIGGGDACSRYPRTQSANLIQARVLPWSWPITASTVRRSLTLNAHPPTPWAHCPQPTAGNWGALHAPNSTHQARVWRVPLVRLSSFNKPLSSPQVIVDEIGSLLRAWVPSSCAASHCFAAL